MKERFLCLLIGEVPLVDGSNYIILEGPASNLTQFKKLDAYTMINFANSEQIRDHYNEKIVPFMKNNEQVLARIRSGRMSNYRGSVVIVEKNGNNFRKLRVLYRNFSSKVTLKEKMNEIIMNHDFMRYLANCDESSNASVYKLFSQYEIDGILCRGCFYVPKEYKALVCKWKNNLKKDQYGLDKLRIVLKKYEEFMKIIEIEKTKRL